MIPRLSESRLLCPADLKPSRDDFEVIGVFNPGVGSDSRRSRHARASRGEARLSNGAGFMGIAAMGNEWRLRHRLGFRRRFDFGRSARRSNQVRGPIAADVGLPSSCVSQA